MTCSQAIVPPLQDVPSNLSVPQFLLDDFRHGSRPERLVDTPCLIDDDTGEYVSMEELRARTQHLASAVSANWTFNEDDIVAIMSFNHINFPPCVWATHRLGGIVATLSPSLSVGELVHHLTIARPTLLFVHTDCLSVAIQAASRVLLPLSRIVLLGGSTSVARTSLQLLSSYQSFDDLIQQGTLLPPVVEKPFKNGEAKTRIAFLAPSSGTTGVQKAVAISHFNVISIIIQAATFNRIGEDYTRWEDRRFRPGDICCGFLPLYHIYGLVYNLHFMLYAGMSLVLAPRFHFENFLKSIERYRMTHLTIVPPQAVLLCKHPAVKNYSLSSVRYCIVAAAPLSASLTSGLLRALPNVVHLGQGYGMTETCGTVSMFPLSQNVGTLGSGGQVLPGTLTKVVKEDGTIAQVGEIGELYVQGGQIALGYYGDEKATKQTFVDGWLRTGDQVFFESNGDIFIVERIKELIKVKGLQVAPAELEGHLLMHPNVADAAVIGTPDEYAGELPKAFVVLQPAAASLARHDPKYATEFRSSIYKHVADAKSKHKWLSGGIAFIDIIPRNASGKILRRLLRDEDRNQSVSLIECQALSATVSAKL
ncbi:amp dependent CoA ligase [Gymnopus androsaceus JB14]|uniref:Amp dependent CoA ligase n=1 Tax=Gymnopus androsaceus JB14 TaxID=1447944 RepID=A0A6A4I0X8_9AGAR|nr:amp dependent CoA ligase [Gymnopus androsaceus JB14]